MEMKRLLLALLPLAMAACNTVPKKEVVEVKVPVPVGCLGKKPVRPASKFGTGDWPGDKAAAQAALADASAWETYATRLEVTMAGCDEKPAEDAQARR
jgi:hypothetical protein